MRIKSTVPSITLGVLLSMAGCVAGSGSAGGGFMVAKSTGDGCYAGQTQVCGYDNGQPAVLNCDGQHWALGQACKSGQTCGFQAGFGSPLTCTDGDPSNQAPDVAAEVYVVDSDTKAQDSGPATLDTGTSSFDSGPKVVDTGWNSFDADTQATDSGFASFDSGNPAGQAEDTADTNNSVPMPKWSMPDIQPKSPGYGQNYGLDKFQGKRVVVLMGAAWCASCMAQAQIMEKVRNEFKAAGMTDFEVAVIVDPNGPGKMVNATSFPIFKGPWSAHKQMLPNGQVHAGLKNDAFAYDHNGRLLGFFQGAGTVYTNYYEDFVRKTLKSPDSPTFFMTCPNAGGSGGCKIQK